MGVIFDDAVTAATTLITDWLRPSLAVNATPLAALTGAAPEARHGFRFPCKAGARGSLPLVVQLDSERLERNK
jgi:hypothetical protein